MLEVSVATGAGMPTSIFSDRREAGRLLGARLRERGGIGRGLVLALPRGGVPVAAEVAAALDLPLDLLLVRKLGVPGQEELAMGAVASGGVVVRNEPLLSRLPIPEAIIEAVIERERAELRRRERHYRGARPAPDPRGRDVIVVDDGLATGSTMRAAIAALRQAAPNRVVVAVPVAPPGTVAALLGEADDVVCLRMPEPFLGVGRWYREFPQTGDDEVRALLARAWHRPAGE
jgi:predicted phosphoribosyltransferase